MSADSTMGVVDKSFTVAFLIGSDNRSTREAIDAVCRIEGVRAAAILLDTHRPALRERVKNLRRNLRRNGWRYIPHRIFRAIRVVTDRLADSAVLHPGEVGEVLRRAFPRRCFNLEDLSRKYGVPVYEAGNLNGLAAAETLRKLNADLGIVLGTRILRETTFAIPRLGSVNLHKGKVPEYRGMPPGFWELYDGARTAGVTVHFVDSKLDTGDVVETEEVAIAPYETPHSLLEKLHDAGNQALVRAITRLRAGTARREPQVQTSTRPKTTPTLSELAEMKRRLPHWHEQPDSRVALKNILYLAIFYSGVYSLLRKSRRESRAAIILYHRVNDYSQDPLTIDTETFAGHLLVMARYYRPMASADLVRRLKDHEPFPSNSVLVHFDDAYRDVHTEGRPILEAVGIPATAFISSGFIDTDRRFEHDSAQYPFHYPNCSREDIRTWIGASLEIGAHTVNHANLGSCDTESDRHEIYGSGEALEQIIGAPVSLFSFPFGLPRNITPEAVGLIREAGYSALFSAYGGIVTNQSDVWDIPRFGVSTVHRPLWLMMEMEGCSLPALAAALKRRMSRKPVMRPASGPAIPAS